jgi:hypothetical protein
MVSLQKTWLSMAKAFTIDQTFLKLKRLPGGNAQRSTSNVQRPTSIGAIVVLLPDPLTV